MSDMNIHLTWVILFSVTEVGEGKMQYVEVRHGAEKKKKKKKKYWKCQPGRKEGEI